MSRSPKLFTLRQGFKQARDLLDKKDYAGCKHVLDQVAVDMTELGISSVAFDWMMGVVLDYLDDEAGSIAHLEKALDADPLSLDAQRSIEIVLANARRTLAEAGLPDDSPRIAMLYAILHARDEADRASHLAFARHRLATGQIAEARALLEAMTLVYYPTADLYELITECASRLGDEAGVVRARGELERLGCIRETTPALGSPVARC